MVTFFFTGDLQTFSIPSDVCSITIRAVGAAGGNGGNIPNFGTNGGAGGIGASIQGDFSVTPGETLSILVGGAGTNSTTSAGGGGGGSFIWRGIDFSDLSLASLLIAAGGGGGGGQGEITNGNPGIDASITTNGTAGNPGGSGGTNGNGGSAVDSGGGGAGVFTDGGSVGGGGGGGTAIDAGGIGGTGSGGGGTGGFGGGGGGAFDGGGGGGGFSGGGGGQQIANAGDGGGGGGGSFNAGSNQINTAGGGQGNGVVEITLIPDTIPPTIECPPDITVFNDPGSNGAIVDYPPPTVSDNCSAVTTVCSPASGSFFLPGTTSVTCTATDAAGNTSTCTFDVTVVVDPCRFFSSRCRRR